MCVGYRVGRGVHYGLSKITTEQYMCEDPYGLTKTK